MANFLMSLVLKAGRLHVTKTALKEHTHHEATGEGEEYCRHQFTQSRVRHEPIAAAAAAAAATSSLQKMGKRTYRKWTTRAQRLWQRSLSLLNAASRGVCYQGGLEVKFRTL